MELIVKYEPRIYQKSLWHNK